MFQNAKPNLFWLHFSGAAVLSCNLLHEDIDEVVVDHIRFSVRPKSSEICKVMVSTKQTEKRLNTRYSFTIVVILQSAR